MLYHAEFNKNGVAGVCTAIGSVHIKKRLSLSLQRINEGIEDIMCDLVFLTAT